MFGRTGLTYGEAKELMQSARSPERGKPLQNNTRLYERTVRIGKREVTGYAVQLHSTDVVTILPGGLYMLAANGWHTVTTRDRISNYAPVYPHTVDGQWMLYVRPSDTDPQPEYPRREIPRFFNFADPGPEPVKLASPECVAGEHHEVTTWERVLRAEAEIDWSRPVELDATSHRRKVQPTRARDVLNHIDSAVSYGAAYIWTWVTHVTDYTAEASNYWTRQKNPNEKQCPHCEAFDRERADWSRKMNGGYGQRGSWTLRCELLDRFGSEDAWREAYKVEGREVYRGQKLYREWLARNTVPFEDGIIVDSNGHVPRSHAELVFKEVRRRERAEKKAQRELERRQREQARVDAFKTKILTKREQARLEREAREQRELEQFKSSVNTENLHIRLADALEHMRPLIG